MQLSRVPLLLFVGLQLGGQARAEETKALKAFQAGDHTTAFNLWMARAKAGDAVCQNNVGFLLLEGLGVTKDQEKACQWFLQAYEGGGLTKDNKVNTAWLLGEGRCQKGNQDLAVRLLTEAINDNESDEGDKTIVGLLTHHAQRNHAEAQYQLARIYKSGEKIAKNEKLAFQWCQKAAATHVDAQILLGEMYLRGTGVRKNVGKAENILLRTALGTATQRDKRLLAELHCYEKKDFVRAHVWLGLSERIRYKGKDEAEPLLGFFVDMMMDTETAGGESMEDRSRVAMETRIESQLSKAQLKRAGELLEHWTSVYDRGLPGVDVGRLRALSVP